MDFDIIATENNKGIAVLDFTPTIGSQLNLGEDGVYEVLEIINHTRRCFKNPSCSPVKYVLDQVQVKLKYIRKINP